MDTLIKLEDYTPTKPQSDVGDLSSLQARILLDQLAFKTLQIKQYPYEPIHWLARARILKDLEYPELAYGDAWKVEYRCDVLIKLLSRQTNLHLGYKAGFLMLHPAANSLTHDNRPEYRLGLIRHAALDLQSSLTAGREESLEFVPRRYPWISKAHEMRSSAVLERVNKELNDAIHLQDRDGSSASVKRDAFDTGSLEDWGVFADKTIEPGSRIIQDTSEISASSRMVTKGRKQPKKCQDHNLRAMMRIKCLLLAFDNEQHPLDHHIISRLKPVYHCIDSITLHRASDFVVPNIALQTAGVDIFADSRYETWVQLTVEARLDNNCWTGLNSCSLNTLFALFNHSCDPNVSWTSQDNRSVLLSATRRIEAGEQLFLNYNAFLDDAHVAVRRQTLRRWIDGDCQCSRCRREAILTKVNDSTWNVAAPLPEDDATNKLASGAWQYHKW